MPRQCISKENEERILSLYSLGKTIKEVGNEVKIQPHTVRRFLLRSQVKLRAATDYKWNPTLEQIKEITRLYQEDKRGIQFIAAYFSTTWENIRDLLHKHNISLLTRKDLARANRKRSGPTKGFTGKKHKNESKKKISAGLFKNCNRTVTGSKSQFIKTIIGKVQGSFELAYLQQCINNNITLPRIGTGIRTPLGLYFPDFQFDDKLIEVKSPFTWRVCLGLEKNPKGLFSDTQYKKIQWVDKHIKPVEIIILTQKEVLPLFRQAIANKNLTIDKVTYTNGKYYVLDTTLKTL